MYGYVIKRLLWAIPTLFGAVTIIFLIMRILPGDVAMNILTEGGARGFDPVEYDLLREQLGLNRPLYEQYFSWLWDLVRLDLGQSMFFGTDVWDEIRLRLPYTLTMVFMSVTISILLSIPIGVLAALHQDRWIDHSLRGFAIIGISIPSFLFGLLILLLVSNVWRWAPPLKYATIFQDPGTALQQLILPALVLGYRSTAVASRMMRSAMLEVMRDDYVRTAWAKGLRHRTVVYVHALRNAILPVVTMLGLETILIFSSSVIIEKIFNVPGVGRLLIDAITERDLVVVQGIVAFIIVFVLVVNLVVDLIYAAIDPRVRMK